MLPTSTPSLWFSPVTTAILETVTCIHQTNPLGRLLLQIETARLFQGLQHVIVQKKPGVGALVVEWMKALREMEPDNMVFFGSAEETLPSLTQEVRRFFGLVLEDPEIASTVKADLEAYRSFKLNCSCFRFQFDNTQTILES